MKCVIKISFQGFQKNFQQLPLQVIIKNLAALFLKISQGLTGERKKIKFNVSLLKKKIHFSFHRPNKTPN